MPKPFYEAMITLIPNITKISHTQKRKPQASIIDDCRHKNHQQNASNPNPTNATLKGSYTNDQLEFTLGMQRFFSTQASFCSPDTPSSFPPQDPCQMPSAWNAGPLSGSMLSSGLAPLFCKRCDGQKHRLELHLLWLQSWHYPFLAV